MSWHDESDHPFAGISEKLKRADENIANLHGEIGKFFESCEYPILPDEDSKEWQEAVDYHSNLIVPIKLSVLCGEIVHHMRSCLDHIAWYFSSGTHRRDHENSIQFPIISTVPPTKDELSRYDRNIKGITNPNVRDLIYKLQPYKRGDKALDHPLCIIHDMERFDKHRELAIIASCVSLSIPGVVIEDLLTAFRYSQGAPLTPAERATAERTLQAHVKASPQIAFVKFGKRKTQPIVPGLQQLLNAVDKVVTLFADEV
jgi:hypothetical protein